MEDRFVLILHFIKNNMPCKLECVHMVIIASGWYDMMNLRGFIKEKQDTVRQKAEHFVH